MILKNNKIKEIGFMCCNCFNTELLRFKVNKISKEDTFIKAEFKINKICNKCHHTMISIDASILEAISTLNKKGYLIRICSDGMDNNINGFIVFEDDKILIDHKEDLPDSWVWNLSDIISIQHRYNSLDERVRANEDILRFANYI